MSLCVWNGHDFRAKRHFRMPKMSPNAEELPIHAESDVFGDDEGADNKNMERMRSVAKTLRSVA